MSSSSGQNKNVYITKDIGGGQIWWPKLRLLCSLLLITGQFNEMQLTSFHVTRATESDTHHAERDGQGRSSAAYVDLKDMHFDFAAFYIGIEYNGGVSSIDSLAGSACLRKVPFERRLVISCCRNTISNFIFRLGGDSNSRIIHFFFSILIIIVIENSRIKDLIH